MAEDPTSTRWLVPADVVPFLGRVRAAPGALGELLTSGTLAGIVLEPGAVLIQAGPGQSWSRIGGQVRTALVAALAEPQGWTGSSRESDEVLAATAAELLTGPIGDLIRGHGGQARLVEVREGVVVLEVAGACAGCPARQTTFTDGFERALRDRHPGLVAVRTQEQPRRLRDRIIRLRRPDA